MRLFCGLFRVNFTVTDKSGRFLFAISTRRSWEDLSFAYALFRFFRVENGVKQRGSRKNNVNAENKMRRSEYIIFKSSTSYCSGRCLKFYYFSYLIYVRMIFIFFHFFRVTRYIIVKIVRTLQFTLWIWGHDLMGSNTDTNIFANNKIK